LRQYDADFDFTAKRLNLFAPDHCDGAGLYWQAATVAVVPFGFDASNHITFRVELDGKRLNAMIDTGAADTVLNLTVAQRRFDVDVNAPEVEKIGDLQGGYTANVYRRRFQTLAFEGVTINRPSLVLLPDLVSGPTMPTTGYISEGRALPDLIIGMPTLSQLHIYIASKEHKLYITQAGPTILRQPQ
jgi:hypothetical protein